MHTYLYVCIHHYILNFNNQITQHLVLATYSQPKHLEDSVDKIFWNLC